MLVMERPIQTYISTKLRECNVLSLADTLVLLVEIRRYIEEFQLQKEYRVLKFYCDWACHSSIDRNEFAQAALCEINLRIRDPNLPFDDSKIYIQAILEAIQYNVLGEQLGKLLYKMIGKPVIIDNHLMCTIIKCLIGIPFLFQKSNPTEKRKNINNQIDDKIKQWNNRAPDCLLTNILTAMEMQKEIVNFMFTNVYKDIVRYDFEVKLSTGETRCGYLQFKQ